MQTSKTPENGPSVFLDAQQTAALLRLSVTTMARWRTQGLGPPYLKVGGRVLYDHAVVIAWANGQCRQSTSEHRREHPATATTELRSTEWHRKYGWR
jgi:hypothetical protein